MDTTSSGGGQLKTEKLKPRKKLPPLLVDLQSRKAERLHWLGSAFLCGGTTHNEQKYRPNKRLA